MRRRLMVLSAAVTSMVALAFLIPLAVLISDLAADRALTAAERDAQSVAQFLAVLSPVRGVDGAIATIGAGRLSRFDVSVVQSDGTVVGAPVPPEEDLSRAAGGTAFRAKVRGGEAVYVPVVQPDGAVLVVRIFVPAAEMTQGVAVSWLTLGTLGIVLVLLAMVVADRLGRWLVRPVHDLSVAAARLGEGDLEARVDPSGPPEIRDVGARFNDLAARVGTLLQQERETAADVSHRLRTPMTALRLDVEGLPDGDRRERLLADFDELERTVDFIIAEARRPIRQEAGDGCDLAAVVASRVRFWGPLAEEQQRQVDRAIEAGAVLPVGVPEQDMNAVVDALVGNVFAHTEEGTALAVTVAARGSSAARLTVEDAGPGFPDHEVVDRGRSGTTSTGLGLDIVRRTVETPGGTVRLGRSDLLGGAAVVIRLPIV